MLKPRVAQIGDLDPLLLRQEPRADLTHGQPLQRRDEPDDLTEAVGLVTARPVVPPHPGNADLSSGGEDAPPSFAQLHEPLTLGRLLTPPRPLFTRRDDDNTTPRISEVLRPLVETALPTTDQFSVAVDNRLRIS